jgi:hypothetical protein
MAVGGGAVCATWDLMGQTSLLRMGFPDALGFRAVAIGGVAAVVAAGLASGAPYG